MNKRHLPLTLLLATLVLFMSACGTSANASSASGAPSSFSIVYQPGLGAAIFISLKLQKTLDKQFPNTNFQWKIANSGSAVREAILSGQGQLGTLGIPPFLVGWDKGMDWKVLLATSRGDSWLVAKDPKFKSLKDFGPNDKIGVVAPDAQQAIELRKLAQQQLGNAHALDRNLVAIGAADGEAALLSGQLAAQLSGPPFQNREVAAGAHIIAHTQDAFGNVGAGVIALPQSFYNQYPAFSKKIYQDLEESSAYVATHHDEVAQELAEDKISGGGGTAAQFKALLDDTSLVFDTTPTGLIAYSKFMQSIGLISKVPSSVSDLELPTIIGTGN
jgi:NitT/TauT family transport system substrate-binding protein